MNSKIILVGGALTGGLLALFIIAVFVLAQIDPGSFFGLCGGFILLSTISAVLVNKILNQFKDEEIDLKILIPVGLFTTIMPLFGATFGLPNSNLISFATLVLLGTVGGVFWSTPFAVWIYFKVSKPSERLTSNPLGINENE